MTRKIISRMSRRRSANDDNKGLRRGYICATEWDRVATDLSFRDDQAVDIFTLARRTTRTRALASYCHDRMAT